MLSNSFAASAQINDQLKPIVKDSVKLSPIEFTHTYYGLKQRDVFRKRLTLSLQAAKRLDSLVQKHRDSVRAQTKRIMDLNADVSDLSDELAAKNTEIAVMKAARTPWWRHPITYGLLGLAAGIYIAK